MNTLAIRTLAAASLSLVAVAPAAAQDFEPAQATITYSDLDLASPSGAEQLAVRLQAGVDTVCARPDSRDLKVLAAWSECRDAAMAGAVKQLELSRAIIG